MEDREVVRCYQVWVFCSPVRQSEPAGQVKFAYDQAPENVDPFFNNVRIGVIIGQHVWDTLVYRDPNTDEYKGQLATRLAAGRRQDARVRPATGREVP